MREFIDKPRAIAGMMEAGYSREQATMIADVANNAVNQVSEKIENAAMSLPEELRTQCYVISWRAVQGVGEMMSSMVATATEAAGLTVIKEMPDGSTVQ